MITMPVDAARWIWETVIPPAVRKGDTNRALCPCQWDTCGACQRDRHDKCVTFGFGERREISLPETYIVDRRGMVANGLGFDGNRVFIAGRNCSYVCPCVTCSAGVPAADVRSGRRGRPAAAAAQWVPPWGRPQPPPCDDDGEPTLFGLVWS